MTKSPLNYRGLIPAFLFSFFIFSQNTVFAACATAEETAAIKDIIEKHNANLEVWYSEGNIEQVAAVFAENAWQFPPNSSALSGRENIKAYWKQAVTFGDWTFNFHTKEVSVCGSLAVERGIYTLKLVAGPNAPPNLPSFSDEGNYLVQWHKEKDGNWRIVADAPVSIRPSPAVEKEK